MYKNNKLALIILDGWGCSNSIKFNAIKNANTPFWHKILYNSLFNTKLFASGKNIGLPKNQVGNSEIGHMILGSGRIIQNELVLINNAIKNKSLKNNKILNNIFSYLIESNKIFHIIGLLSSGGVHSHEKHMFYLIKLAAEKKVKNIYIHIFLDGRDTNNSGIKSIQRLKNLLSKLKVGKLVSIIGRFYAMDRDKNWNRIHQAYKLIIEGKSEIHFTNPIDSLLNCYNNKIYDEFIPPILLLSNKNKQISNEDIIFLLNFRSDRIKQFIESIIENKFSFFSRKKILSKNKILSFNKIHNNITHILKEQNIKNTLGQIIQDNNFRQLRISESEKFHHVTSFFNCNNIKFNKEEHIIVDSHKVNSYDQNPQMQSTLITKYLLHAIKKRSYDLIVCNYANADMLGHTGNYYATIKSIEQLDLCLSKIYKVAKINNYNLCITADHGNAEIMFDEINNVNHTRHTMNLVPFVYIGANKNIKLKSRKGIVTIADVAPTILEIMNINKPKQMSGTSLFKILPKKKLYKV